MPKPAVTVKLVVTVSMTQEGVDDWAHDYGIERYGAERAQAVRNDVEQHGAAHVLERLQDTPLAGYATIAVSAV